MTINKYLAELFGTFILVFVGSFSILAAAQAGIHPILTAPFGFGLGLLAAIYAVGHVSGGHFNPAVTLAMFLDKRTDLSDLIGYWIGQVVGALLASLVVLLATSQDAVAGTYTSPGQGVGDGSAFLLELAMTAVFVWVILASTRTSGANAAVIISLTLVAVHFAAVPITGASVNPVRSLAPAIVGAEAGSLWLYIVGPLVGAVVAWALYRAFPANEDA